MRTSAEGESRTSALSFYIRLLWGVPKAVWEASDWWWRVLEIATLAGIIIPPATALAVNEVRDEWPWIALGSFLVLFVFGFLRSNYRAFTAIERRAADVEEAERTKGEVAEAPYVSNNAFISFNVNFWRRSDH